VRHARQLGQYTLEEKLGEGGMGVVYRARHAMLRRPTAVKLLKPERMGEAGLQRFEREVQLTAGLSHPNTVTVFDYGRTPDGVFYYAMEYLEGLGLDQLVAADGPQPPARTAHILRQVLEALAEAHGVGLVHRDVKPANVYLCRAGRMHDFAKVLDFGLVKRAGLAGGDVKLTAANVATGTPAYMAPELALGDEEIDGRADLYAVGCLAYWLLTGSQVFDAPSPARVMFAHVRDTPPPPSTRAELEIPAALETLVMRCLAKDPADRPQTAEELADGLLAAVPGEAWTSDQAARWWRMHLPELAA
jgi:serine/threonine-protein kinase